MLFFLKYCKKNWFQKQKKEDFVGEKYRIYLTSTYYYYFVLILLKMMKNVYSTRKSSTSKVSVAFGGMIPGCPREPYAKSGEQTNLAR